MEKEGVITNIRSFNRLYTNILGLLNKHILDSEFSLTEIRILYEIDKNYNCTSGMLVKLLKIDKSYLSRIIKKFEKENFILKKSNIENSRVALLELTEKGNSILKKMNIKSTEQISNLISKLSEHEYKDINNAINILKKNLLFSTGLIKIRPFLKSDINLIISEQTNLFEKEYNFKTEFWKHYLKKCIEKFSEKFNENTDCMYVIDYEGEILGSIAVVKSDNNEAQLRFFYVNSKVRGIGAGNKLINIALQFCKEKKYKKVVLWTEASLVSARKLYKSIGFEIKETQINNKWSENTLTEEKWELKL